MKCKFCREEIPDGVKFCPMCGSVVPEEKKIENQQPEQMGGYSYGIPQSEPTGSYSYGTTQSNQPINGTVYMVLSILSLLLCCLPLGIASIIYSSKINSQQKNGDYAGARESAKNAKILLIISFVFGLIVNIAVIAYSVFGLSSKDSWDNSLDDISDMVTEDQDYSESDEEQGEDGLDGDLDGISDEEIKPAKAVSKLGDNWNSYTVKINDGVLALPCEYKELEALGFVINEDGGLSNEDGTVSEKEYAVGFMTGKDGTEIMAEFINPSDEVKKVEECLVGGISIYDYSEKNDAITFPGNIQIGATEKEVIEKYGETEEVYGEGEFQSYSWYDEERYYSGVEMGFVSGKLCEMSIRNYGWGIEQ